jgi:signal transduction histidine kinase
MMTLFANRWKGSGRWLSMAMLVTLHLALWVGIDSIWARPLLFAHLGLFLMWQPLWRGEDKLRLRSAIFIVAVSTLALFWLNWWILAFWVSGLFAVVGGRVFAFQGFWQRVRYLMAMGYLLAVNLFWVTPHLFALLTSGETSNDLMNYIMPLLLFSIFFVPQESERLSKTVAVDLVYSILLFMLLTLLVLGSLAFMTLGHVDYFQSLLRTLFLIALVLFALGWLWNPRLGFSGFQLLFSRHFLNIGTPFEVWLRQLAVNAHQETSPEVFLESASVHLLSLPWVTGLNWETSTGQGKRGVSSEHTIEWVEHDLCLRLFTRQKVAPAVLMHIHLLCQMLDYFYQSKRREQRLREMARLQAVHETGARLTHDLKNMLQSLLALISIAEQQPIQAQPILKNQLPLLANQIEQALTKLKVRKEEIDTKMMPLQLWWNNLQQRHQYRNLHWIFEDDMSGKRVPYALFDSVAENLIENARNKRLSESDIQIHISLQAQPFKLSVSDSGSAIPQDRQQQLMHTVIDSENGLGIGLFQAARWAEQLGYHLCLQENQAGLVRFEMTEIGTI